MRLLLTIILLLCCGNAWGALPGWSYYKTHTVTGTEAGQQTDYAVPITVQYGSGSDSGGTVYLGGKCKTDFSDLRFTDTSDTLLSHWIETKTDSTSATVWVKIPTIPASPGTVNVRLWYGNAGASYTGSVTGVFPLLGFDYDVNPTTGKGMANAAARLSIPTYTGSPSYQAVHPGVWVFDTPWNGYTHWMAFTPFPGSTQSAENPSIVASNDGVTWVVPNGLTNPVVVKPIGANGYNADTDLIYNAATNELWMYYKFTSDSTNFDLRAVKSSDGVTWTDLDGGTLTTTDNTNRGTIVKDWGAAEEVSHSIQKIDTTWHMWTVVASSKAVRHRTSSDGRDWGAAPVACTFTASPLSATLQPWHGQIKYIAAKNKYVAILTSGNTAGAGLYYATSDDGEAFTYYTMPLIDVTEGGWDNGQIYRSVMWYDSGSDSLRVWYSAKDTSGTPVWGTGYTSETWTNITNRMTTGIYGGWELTAITNLGYRYKDSPGQARSGTRAAILKGAGDVRKTIASGNNVQLEFSLYDTDQASASYQHFAGFLVGTNRVVVGVYTGSSTTHYVRANNTTFASTGVARSTGWHKFAIKVSGTSYTISVDGTPVETVTNTANPNYIKMFKALTADSYIDNLIVRQVASTEPTSTAWGAEVAVALTTTGPKSFSFGLDLLF